MPFYLIHAGNKIQKMSVAGVAADINLPTGVTISTTNKARFAILNGVIFVANAPSVNLVITNGLYCNLASLTAPAAAPTFTQPTAGVLTGAYVGAYTFAIKVSGIVVAESPLSASGTQITLASKKLLFTVGTGAQTGTNCRRLYRSASGGGTLYHCHDIDDNSTLTYDSNELDAALGTEDVNNLGLGNPPGTTTADRMKLLVAWKDRLWGVSNLLPDDLRFTGDRLPYAWDPDNMIPAPPKGMDTIGINGFIPRRDELGVARRDLLYKVVGSSPDDFRLIKIVEGVGCIAPDSVVVVRDVAYWLGMAGVFEWGPEGVVSISDETVRPWFSTDSYFNRAKFAEAFGRYNARTHSYELHLSNLGSSTMDRWVQYDIRRKRWFGPHLTSEMTPTCGGQVDDANGNPLSVIGSSTGFFYKTDQAAFVDGATTAIDFDVTTQPYVENSPDLIKLFRELSMINKSQAAGDLTISVTTDDVLQSGTIACPLTVTRSRLRRLGIGRSLKLRLRQNTVSQGCELYGFEVPYHLLGRR